MTTLTHAPKSPYGVKPWPRLSAPVDPLDSVLISRAQSILVALVGVVDLTEEQARDIVAWHQPQH